MNLKEIEQLIDIINKSDIGEATIEEGDFKITLKRTSQMAAMPQAQTSFPVIAPPSAPAAPSQPSTPGPEPDNPAKENLIEIRSPIVGTFYRSPSPESDVFVSKNDHIQSGDVLCIVEAMKLMNEIEAELSGTIIDILVENGQPVEYDQVLFLVKP
ncbi:acetyl-CoA carboxylase, biotin carboxyl carrier protein [Prosthecochloris sp. ZM]|uniref:acetyl-CoA carboxylase biotin carboxyl carrier protein n=1 Tax=Prosthecochloris sp. ZM TaxID=2283143 RepID=UPI000DF829D2|nr:acetyl-CoA carboxylase biotin carboxyl carrier protein [Prosthecochloris sp. ZM]RDD31449.1 acetyl-CoA carboxylase, biotin carboxyl carrier protein [Prosthecochloris sp. ZM]